MMLQRVKGLPLRVDGKVGAIGRAHQRAAVQENACVAVFPFKGRRTILPDVGIQAGGRAFAEQQAIRKEIQRARVGADQLPLQGVVDAVVGVAVRHHIFGKIDRHRRRGIRDNQSPLPIDHRGLPLFILDRGQAAVRELARLRIGEREYGPALFVQIAGSAHAVDIRAGHGEDRARRRGSYHHDTRHKQGGNCFFEHSHFHPWILS